jgi:hypothetical protein
MASMVDSSASRGTNCDKGTATLRPCQRISASMSAEHAFSGAMRDTSPTSPFLSGDTTLEVTHFARKGNLSLHSSQ